jgi:hypothetical protein
MPERDINFAKNLAASGNVLDFEIGRTTKQLVNTFHEDNLFLIAIAQSLTWTGHAIDKEDYFKNTLNFLNTGAQDVLSDIAISAGRYGQEKLQATLYNWRELLAKLKLPPDLSKSSMEEIILFQDAAYKIACMERRKERIMGIGAWLFCAPFKIILNFRDELWKNDRIDEVLMPLGLEVVRGVKKLIKQRYSYSRFIEEGDLSETEGDIIEGLATIHIVQHLSKEIAKDSKSIVLHINSGLWELGAGNL